MRGIIGLVLTGLGAFLILVAVLLPTYIAGEVIKFPQNEYQSATLEASNASYFSAKTLSEQTGVTMQATYTIKTNPKNKGNSSTSVWDEFSWVQDVTNHVPVQSQSRTFAFDRKTAQLVDCCGASVNGDSSVKQTGIVGYVFPMNTQKQTYQVFDATLKKDVPFTYSGTANVNGIQTYKFTNSYGATQTGTTPFLGNLVGSTSALVTLPEYSSLQVAYYVDPETGALLNVNEHQTTTVRNPANGQSVTVFDAALAITPASLSNAVALDNSGRSKITLLETILPIVGGIVGAVLLFGGVLLGRRRRDDLAELDPLARQMAESAVTEPAQGRHASELAGVVPGHEDEAQAPAAEMPEGEGPEASPGPRSAGQAP